MKKTFVTLMATAALAAVVAPAVSATTAGTSKPYAETKTLKDPNVEQYNLKVSSKNVLYGKAWDKDVKAGLDLVEAENIYNSAVIAVDELERELKEEQTKLNEIKKMYEDDLGYVGTGVVPATFKPRHEGNYNIPYPAPLNTIAGIDAHYQAAIAHQETVIAGVQGRLAAAKATLAGATTNLNNAKAAKSKTEAAVAAAKAELDKAIEEARAAGVFVTPTVEVTRLYNAATGAHYFTTVASRVAGLEGTGFKAEGVAFKAPVTGTPVYAVVNPSTGYSHFTANADEINSLVALGWVKGEIVFHTAEEGVSVKRLYNPNTSRHFFTSNEEEIKGLVARGWKLEGHAYFVAE